MGKKNLVIKQQELLSPLGDNVSNFKEGDRVPNTLVNLFFTIFEEESDIVAIDASSGCSNSIVNVNFHWSNGASTLLEICEDDSKTLQ